MKAARLLLLFCVLAFAPQCAWAAQFSGEYLISVCDSDENGKELIPGSHIACQAYISGIMDYHNLIRSLGTAPSVDFCVPEDVPLNVLQNRVTYYLKQNRKVHAKFTAAPAVALALFEMYPCEGASVKVRKPK
ncbi:MAG: hypothetical protein KDJ35_07260 [Alphaproteobacteria bacterium]|nr:hypothetical protein [Alphaproteobacteria bacterium]